MALHRRRHRVGLGLPLARRRLDIGQQERDRPSREHEATRTRRARHRRVSPTDNEPQTRLATNVIIHAPTITRSALWYIADMGDAGWVMAQRDASHVRRRYTRLAVLSAVRALCSARRETSPWSRPWEDSNLRPSD